MLKTKGAGNSDMQKIGFSLRVNSLHIQPNSLKQIAVIFEDSGGDPVVFKEKLNQWYNEMMERLSGWFKRKIQFVLFMIGLAMAITFNVDSISIAKKLSKDKNAREQMVQLAISASDSNSAIAKSLRQTNDSTLSDSLLQDGYRQVKQASDDAGMILGLGWNLDNLSKGYTSEIPNTRLITCWNYAGIVPGTADIHQKWDADSLRITRLNRFLADSMKHFKTADQKAALSKFTGSVNYFNCVHFIRVDKIVAGSGQQSTLEGRRNYFAIEKIAYVLRKSFSNWLVLLGFIITALAISLGSNFWFDLLNKLVSMRSSGVKPAEKAVDTTEADTDALPGINLAKSPGKPLVRNKAELPDDLISALVNRYAEELLKIPGVRSVFKGKIMMDGVQTSCIRINVADELSITRVEKAIGGIPGAEEEIPINIVVAGRPQTHQGLFAGQISNKSGLNGTGSIGCVVKHQETGKTHILSCWHVMKGDLNYDADDASTTIVDHQKQDLAIRWAGGIDQSYDFAFARCLPGMSCDNEFLRSALKLGAFSYRPVTEKDINAQTGIRYYDSINGQVRAGKIYAWSAAVIINYPDKARSVSDILVLTDDSSGQEQTISQSGNSGSLIFDSDGAALGMIIGGDNMFSYAVRLSNIFSLFTDMKIL
jgi:hypothetical protein